VTKCLKMPDHQLFGSLPGAGPKIAPRLPGETGFARQDLASADPIVGSDIEPCATVFFPGDRVERSKLGWHYFLDRSDIELVALRRPSISLFRYKKP
jgi:hypothetical protein